jgi:hypothetical protein
MHKKIIVLFLLAASAVVFLPARVSAAVGSETNNSSNVKTADAAFLQTYRISRNRRWRFRAQNRRYGRYRSSSRRSWNNRWNRRNNRMERRENRRDRRENRRERREDRRDNRN